MESPRGEGENQTPHRNFVNSAVFEDCAANSAAVGVTNPELLPVICFWPDLSDSLRLAVLVLVVRL
jgi:hypothetical protein